MTENATTLEQLITLIKSQKIDPSERQCLNVCWTFGDAAGKHKPKTLEYDMPDIGYPEYVMSQSILILDPLTKLGSLGLMIVQNDMGKTMPKDDDDDVVNADFNEE